MPIVGLLLLCVLMALVAGPMMAYLGDTASFLHQPSSYVEAVLGTGAVAP